MIGLGVACLGDAFSIYASDIGRDRRAAGSYAALFRSGGAAPGAIARAGSR